MKKEDIIKKLKAADIKHDPNATNEELKELLPAPTKEPEKSEPEEESEQPKAEVKTAKVTESTPAVKEAKASTLSDEERNALIKAKVNAGLTPEQARQVVASQEAFDAKKQIN